MGSALRDGTLVCWKVTGRWEERNQHDDGDKEGESIVSNTKAHDGEVTHFATLGVGRVGIMVTASNADQHLRTWRVLHKTGALEGAIIKLEPLRELKLKELGIGALCTSTGMGVSHGVIALGFGNGRVCLIDGHTCHVMNIIPVHGDEVWDVRCAGGGLMVSSSRDRKVAAFRIHPPFPNLEGSKVFLQDVGNRVVRVKATTSRL